MSFNLSLEERNQLKDAHLKNAKNIFFGSTLAQFTNAPLKKTCLIEDKLDPAQVLQLVHRRQINHVIQNSFQSLEEKIQIMSALDKDTYSYYDIEFDLLVKKNRVKILKFFTSTEREKVMSKSFEFLQIDPSSARNTKVQSVLEEMVMNAQISAPTIRRSDKVLLSEIKIEQSDDLVSFSLIDRYGALNTEKFLMKVESGLSVGMSNAINYGRGGAGVGSSIIFNFVDSLYLGCIPNKITRVSVVMPYNKSEKKLELIQKSLNIV